MKNSYATILITRPNHDHTTNYLYYWAGEVIEEAEKRKFSIIDLDKKRANKKEFENITKKTKPDFVFFNGHGDQNTVTGYDNDELVVAGKNESILDNKIVYALSCQSAKNLGKQSVKSGAVCYIGYDDDFVFMFEEGRISRPLQDQTAGLFLGPSNQLVISLLKGNSTGESYKSSQSAFEKNIKSLLTSESPQTNKGLLPYLFWDKGHQVCLGDKNAKLI